LDQKVHHERSGQTVFIILVSEHQVDHDAVVVVACTRGDWFVGVLDMYADRFRLVFLLYRSGAVRRIDSSSQRGEFWSAISGHEVS
jgi:hypothetical protein